MEIIDMSTKRKLKKMVSVLFILGCFFIGNTKCKGADLEYISQETANYAVQERGYDFDFKKLCDIYRASRERPDYIKNKNI